MLPPGADGYMVNALPTARLASLAAAHPDLKPFVRQRYRRSYASLEGGFDAYLAGFSARSRSTLKRKARKLAERSGGAVDVTAQYRGAERVKTSDVSPRSMRSPSESTRGTATRSPLTCVPAKPPFSLLLRGAVLIGPDDPEAVPLQAIRRFRPPLVHRVPHAGTRESRLAGAPLAVA